MIKLFSILVIGLACLHASAQEEKQETPPFKKTRVAYKYHARVDDADDVKSLFPKNGHTVQIARNFAQTEIGFFSFVLDYTHLPKYQDPHLLSAGFDISWHPGEMFADLDGKPYSSGKYKWTLTSGWYKTLDKYRVNYISNASVSYRVSLGGVDLLPSAGFSWFDEASLFSRRKAGEHDMGYATFGLIVHFK